jgi:RluA family pseudouridine synthase
MKIERWVHRGPEDRLPNVMASRGALNLSSRKQARRLIDEGYCSINGHIQKLANTVVFSGDQIEVVIHEKEESSLEILYEDEWLCILNKPVGMIVDPITIDQLLGQRVYLVHRLDKQTSGLFIVAKDLKTQKYFENKFRKREVKKGYLAVVDGRVKPSHGLIEKPLEKKKGETPKFGVSPSGKSATTLFRVVLSSHSASLLFLRPLTGRTHQLRVHMASLDHPILGDHRYASQFGCSWKAPRYLLHAWKIAFVHPEFEKELSWTARIPSDMISALKALFGGGFRNKLCALSL